MCSKSAGAMNARKLIYAVVAAILTCVFALVSHAKVTKLTLHEMVSRSESIVVARVSSIIDTGETRMGYPVAMIKVSIETTLKGISQRSLEVYEIPTAIETARFSIYDRCVLFLIRHEGRLWVLQGFAGKVNILSDEARDIYMAGEEEVQPLSRFLTRISSNNKTIGDRPRFPEHNPGRSE
jgi:hypothetical protein